VGRSEERMNFGGRKVDPNLVDATIRAISGIRDAAVFGFDQPSGIRGLAAAVVAESNYSDEKLMKAIAEALGSKRPQVLIRVKSITRNAMGKVQRIDLEKEFSEEANRRAK
jgi:O-succinylbenzoic acid--CoA ligase